MCVSGYPNFPFSIYDHGGGWGTIPAFTSRDAALLPTLPPSSVIFCCLSFTHAIFFPVDNQWHQCEMTSEQ